MLVKAHSIAASTSSSLSSVPARLRMNNIELGRHGRFAFECLELPRRKHIPKRFVAETVAHCNHATIML
jgi:hypothetical protein